MSFGRPDLLWLAIALPVLATIAIIGYYRRRRTVANRLGDQGLIRRIGGEGLQHFPTKRILLVVPAALLIGAAAASPQWGVVARETQGRSLDLALVLDLSKSMLARDVEPNRLERQRLFVSRILRELAGDRIGLVVFAGRAYTLSPLTTDHSALLLYIDALDPDIISQGGSSHASAIAHATELLRTGNPGGGDQVILLITDGEAHDDEGAVISAAERAQGEGVVIHTVGIGTTDGAPVPDLDAFGRTVGYKRYPETGEIVISRLDPDLLERVAGVTGGSYTTVDQAGATNALVSRIRGMRRAEAEDRVREIPRERFAWFVALALGLMVIDALGARRGGSTSTPLRGTTIALALVTALALGIGDLEKGNRLYRQGRYAEAVEAYRAALRDGNDSPQLHYNLGTALLRLGEHQEAEDHLRHALSTIDPEERERALYNLGNRFLEAGIDAPDPKTRGEMLGAAADAYRSALRLDPDDIDAKWNLELALREQEMTPEMGGGGGEGDEESQPVDDDGAGGQDDGDDGMMPPPGWSGDPDMMDHGDPGAMSREEAERLLSAIEQAERDLQRSKLRKGRRDTPVARDW